MTRVSMSWVARRSSSARSRALSVTSSRVRIEPVVLPSSSASARRRTMQRRARSSGVGRTWISRSASMPDRQRGRKGTVRDRRDWVAGGHREYVWQQDIGAEDDRMSRCIWPFRHRQPSEACRARGITDEVSAAGQTERRYGVRGESPKSIMPLTQSRCTLTCARSNATSRCQRDPRTLEVSSGQFGPHGGGLAPRRRSRRSAHGV